MEITLNLLDFAKSLILFNGSILTLFFLALTISYFIVKDQVLIISQESELNNIIRSLFLLILATILGLTTVLIGKDYVTASFSRDNIIWNLESFLVILTISTISIEILALLFLFSSIVGITQRLFDIKLERKRLIIQEILKSLYPQYEPETDTLHLIIDLPENLDIIQFMVGAVFFQSYWCPGKKGIPSRQYFNVDLREGIVFFVRPDLLKLKHSISLVHGLKERLKRIGVPEEIFTTSGCEFLLVIELYLKDKFGEEYTIRTPYRFVVLENGKIEPIPVWLAFY